MELTSENIRKVFLGCLFDEGYTKEDLKRAKEVQSVIIHVGFDSGKVEKHRDEIISLLDQLPDGFRKSSENEGMSFLEACVDKNGHQYGEHQNVDELLALGIAIDKIEFPIPRELWIVLPGSLPYIIYNDID